jgi:hypothetical protein
MSNLPPGVSVSMLPGWHDITETVSITCPKCDHDYEEEHEIDGRNGRTTEVDTQCPRCLTTWEHPITVGWDL